MDITGWVLGVLLTAGIVVVFTEAVLGLAHPAGGQLSFAALSPAHLTSAGFGSFGVLAVVAVLGFVVLGGSEGLSQAAQWLFLTSLFAAALAFHNVVWRYIYALGRENVLPAVLGRTGGNIIPKTASLVQSGTAWP